MDTHTTPSVAPAKRVIKANRCKVLDKRSTPAIQCELSAGHEGQHEWTHKMHVKDSGRKIKFNE